MPKVPLHTGRGDRRPYALRNTSVSSPTRLATVAFSLSVLGIASAALASSGPARPNIVLIVVDTLRADAVPLSDGASPNLAAFARNSVTFTRAFANASWTDPSISSLFTSRYPFEHGVGARLGLTQRGQVPTLVEALAAQGYSTHAFVQLYGPELWHQGFQQYSVVPMSDSRSPSGAVFDLAAKDLAQARTEPVFLFLHTYEVHHYFAPHDYAVDYARRRLPGYTGPFANRKEQKPYDAYDALARATPEDTEWARALYDGTIARLDVEFGTFERELEKLGLTENTIIVLMSDHGEGFQPELHRVHHGGRLHADLLRIPLMMRWPGRLTAQIDDRVTTPLDVMPTLLQLAEVKTDTKVRGRALFRWQASSWLGSWFQKPKLAKVKPWPETAMAEESVLTVLDSGERQLGGERQVGLYSRGSTLIVREARGGRVELYDLDADPGQQHNRAADREEQVRLMSAEIGRITLDSPGLRPQIDPETLSFLRALGYLQ